MLLYIQNIVSKLTISIGDLEKSMLRRFQLYNSINESKSTTDDDDDDDDDDDGRWYLIHLFMAFVALDYPVFVDSFTDGETKLFLREFLKKDINKKKERLTDLLNYLNYLSQREEVKRFNEIKTNKLILILRTAETLVNKCDHVFDESHEEGCKEAEMTLPFTFLSDLVAKRRVVVSKGKITLFCGSWFHVLEAVFKSFIKLELELLKTCKRLSEIVYDLEDDRLRQVIKRFTNMLRGTARRGLLKDTVRAADVDSNAQYFPPCMANLHQILRRTHRLSYASRYQYTLFLRDIGMPVNENILFWENEYRKPCHGSSCTHEWTEKRYRYKYQIEHIYGLIGNRELKTSYSCKKFVEELKSKMDGGCPFKHLSGETLRKSIPAELMDLPDVEDIFKYKEIDMPQSACSVYLSCQRALFLKRQRNSGCEDKVTVAAAPHVISPIQYYNFSKHVAQG